MHEVLLQAGELQCFLVPADGYLGKTFFKEALCEPCISLHDVREGVTPVHELADLLQFANRFVKQTHFTECDAEVVMRFRVFLGSCGVMFKFLLEFAKHP